MARKGLRTTDPGLRVLGHSLPPEDLAVADALGVPGNLPQPLTRFVGREEDVAGLRDLLQDERLVTVTGPGGIGKTRLAVEVAGRAAVGYLDGAWFADLAKVSDTQKLPAAVGSLFRKQKSPPRGMDTLIEELRDKRLLLVLDNCEHLVDAVAEFAETLLQNCENLVVLATSREALDVPGERIWKLSSMAVPPPEVRPTTEKILEYESVRLFLDRAAAVRADFVWDDENAAAAAEICRRLEGVPLAIGMAAARLKSLSVQGVLEGLEHPFEFLRGAGRTTVERHKTLRADLDWSHDLLSPAEQTLLRRLSIFAGGFTVEAARQVCAGKRLRTDEIPALVDSLESKSLLISEVRPDETRYRMLDTVREYARTKLQGSGDKAMLVGSHFAWCLNLAEEAELGLSGPDQLLWLRRLDEADPDLVSALDGSIGTRKSDAALRLAGSLATFWASRGRFAEGRDRLRAVLEASTRAAETNLAKALWGLGLHAGQLGEFEQARDAAERSLDVYRELGDPQGRARSLTLLASIFLFRHPRRALSLAEEGTSLARQASDNWCLPHALRIAGDAHMMLGSTETAGSLFQECLDVARAAGDRATTAAALVGMAWFRIIGAQTDGAETLLNEALRLADELGDPFVTAEASMFLGDMATARGQASAAETRLNECLRLAHRMGSKVLTARALGGLGRLAVSKGDDTGAEGFFESAINEATEGNLTYILIRVLHGKGSSRLRRDDLQGALDVMSEALEAARGIGDKQGMSVSLLTMGTIARHQGDDERAGSLLHEALLISASTADRYRVMRALRALGDLAGIQGRFSAAVRMLAAAHALKHGGEPGRSPAATCNCERVEAEGVRHQLSQAEFESAWTQGISMSMEEAVAYTSRRRRTREDRPTSGWASLTRAEREVVDLLQEGLTNSEIAERLYVSSRTVGAHLSHIYGKLGLKSRKEVARQAALRNSTN